MTELFFLLKGIFVPCLGKNFFLPRKKKFLLNGRKIEGGRVFCADRLPHQSVSIDDDDSDDSGGYLFLHSRGNLQSQYYIYIYIILN